MEFIREVKYTKYLTWFKIRAIASVFCTATLVTNVTAEVLSSIPGLDKMLLGFFGQEFLSSSHVVWICTWVLVIGCPDIGPTKHKWRIVGVELGTPLPNP